MANLERGEARLTVDGREYTIKLTINAQCELEERFSSADRLVTYTEISRRISEGSIVAIRAFLWACLIDRHRAEFPTPESAGALIQAAGGPDVMMSALLAASKGATPSDADLDAIGMTKASESRPTQPSGAIDGTTTPSIAPLVALG